MSDQKTVLYKKEGSVARILFNRPDSLNAYNEIMMQSFKSCLQKAKEDSEVKVIILSGVGRAFSAGVDLKTTTTADFQKGASFMELGHEVGALIGNMPKVTIAQVHGYCFTGALEIMLFFDMAYCSDTTQFGDTHAKWGIIPRWGMTQRLARRVGLAKAKELTFRAMRVKGPEAERIGLVNRAFPDASLHEEVQKIAEEISANSHEAIVAIKKLYDDGYHTTLSEGLRLELETDTQLGDTTDNISQFESKKFSSNS